MTGIQILQLSSTVAEAIVLGTGLRYQIAWAMFFFTNIQS